MKLIFAGSGGAFAPMSVATREVLTALDTLKAFKSVMVPPQLKVLEDLEKACDPYGRWHSNMLFEQDGYYLAIDMGGDARHSIGQLGIPFANIEAIYCSHTHGDHAYGFEWYMLLKYFMEIRAGKDRPTLFGASDVIARLWYQALSASLETIENTREANLTTFVDVKSFDPHNPKPFMWRGIEFQPIQTVHVMSGPKLQPSWGLLVQQKFTGTDYTTPVGVRGPHGRTDLDKWTGKKIFITTDTQFAPYQLAHFYDLADEIFHDCETLPFKSGVHAHFKDLKVGLPEKVRKKTRFYHNTPNPPHEEAKEAGFLGFVKAGEVFDYTVTPSSST